MKSLILIILYLCKDTLNRWWTRPSSPLARFLVVGFLSLSTLIFLSNYILSAKILESEIGRNGGNLIVFTDNYFSDKAVNAEYSNIFPQKSPDYDCLIFNELFAYAKIGQENYPIVEYPEHSCAVFAKMKEIDSGIYVLPRTPIEGIFPIEIMLEAHTIHGVTLPQKYSELLTKIYQSGAIFVPEGSATSLKNQGYIKKYIISLHELNPEKIQKIETALNNIIKLDKRSSHIQSSKNLLKELEKIRQNQFSYRCGISLGISLIVGILLTSISSMEFKENEYVYALMNSFGVSRVLLILTFIAENAVIAFLALGVAIATLLRIQPIITKELFKKSGIEVSLYELSFDIQIIATALIVCVLISTIPIIFSAYRPIGRVLK